MRREINAKMIFVVNGDTIFGDDKLPFRNYMFLKAKIHLASKLFCLFSTCNEENHFFERQGN